jgi:hypothetical protein
MPTTVLLVCEKHWLREVLIIISWMKREADVTHNFQKYGSNATMAAVTK